MFRALREAFVYEVESIKESYYKLFLITLFPILSFVLMIAIFYSGVVRDMPIVVVDNDKSRLSRLTLSHIEASPTIKIAYTADSMKEASSFIKEGKAYALVLLPSHFEKDVFLQKQPKITAMVNTQYILIGKILSAALSTTIMHSAGEVEYVNNLQTYSIPSASLEAVSPIGMQITPFFNTYQNYFLFLVSALLPSIWQIFIVVTTLVAFGSMFKQNKEREFFKDGYVEMRIIGKLLPYTFAYLLLGVLYLFYIYGTLGWEFEGSFAITIFAMLLTVIAYQAVALLFFVTGFDYARSLSLGAVYTAPAFAFLGVTFPIYNMNTFALLWRDLLPISHYMELQISQGYYGANPFLEIDKLLYIFAFWSIFIVVFIAFRRRLKS